MLSYDNLEDVRAKLNGTLCFYAGKAILVKECYTGQQGIDNEMFAKEYLAKFPKFDPKKDFAVSLMEPGGRAKRFVLLSDPLLNYMDFRLGYVNHAQVAVWWYRQPIRQYKQGLKHEQLGYQCSNKAYQGHFDFSFSRPVADMMENTYPVFADAVGRVKAGDANICAFHKNFAVSWDVVHQDVILEYKGRQIGHSAGTNSFKLMEDCQHLTEALKEAMG